MKIVSHSLEETQQIAKDWLKEISTGREKFKDNSSDFGPASAALTVGLYGELGAGKTAFVKAVAKELGIKETVTSPTFVLMKIYVIPGGGQFAEVSPRQDDRGLTSAYPWKKLIHIDAYRLEKRDDVKVLGLEELKKDKGNLIMIEWPEKVGISPEETHVWIEMKTQDDLSRVLKFIVEAKAV
ncbi:MAG: tRNA (adenosine(37)-N6)-threonylcarbamoyltransferase complex ATPase subunit type 1 TsaE [Candidatus Paceibacterota bacterium]|jgi:tRNA threonylcarbamoyladenosine biosynthesis protein TsaE